MLSQPRPKNAEATIFDDRYAEVCMTSRNNPHSVEKEVMCRESRDMTFPLHDLLVLVVMNALAWIGSTHPPRPSHHAGRFQGLEDGGSEILPFSDPDSVK